MDSLESFLGHAKTRDELHRWIDSLPIDADVLLLAGVTTDGGTTYPWRCTESLSVAVANWMVDVYKDYLQAAMRK